MGITGSSGKVDSLGSELVVVVALPLSVLMMVVGAGVGGPSGTPSVPDEGVAVGAIVAPSLSEPVSPIDGTTVGAIVASVEGIE
jgi:hypothetical protein